MLIWERAVEQFANGSHGMLGKWKIFYVHYDGGRSRNDPDKYALGCSLPGIKDHLGHFREEEEAKVKAESVLVHWLKKANLTSSIEGE
jgi:hypothetical protein